MSYNVIEYIIGWHFNRLHEGEKWQIYLKPFFYVHHGVVHRRIHTHTHAHTHSDTHSDTHTQTHIPHHTQAHKHGHTFMNAIGENAMR